MIWIKKGKIFSVNRNFGWMNSHSQIPTVLVLNDRLRIYFATREVHNESKIAFLDVDIANPSKIIYLHNKPILEKGKPGTFDEHGVMPSFVFKKKDKIYLYYSGWSRRCLTPYSNLTGIAVSNDGVKFKRLSEGPVLTINIYEPYSATSPFLIENKDNFYIFYCSGTGWKLVDNKFEHLYNIKYSIFNNFINFEQKGLVAIKTLNNNEAITRPTVLKLNNIFHMWFCYRGIEDFRDGKNAYKIGYAWSEDLIHWHREDEKAGIEVSSEGWDSKMIAYPYVIKTKYGIYMFYNGNGFGKSGFGYAILRD